MKTISVITLHRVPNYGSVLQTYATQEVFRHLGCSSTTIDYWPKRFQPDERIAEHYRTFRFRHKNFLVKWAFSKVMRKSLVRQDAVFGDFLSRRIALTKPYYSIESLVADPPAADIYCTGSDQVWNTKTNGFVESPFYLNFVPKNKRRIAFSASFGRDTIPNDEREAIAEDLLQYTGIGVREPSGLNILRSLGIKSYAHTLDPTLAVSPSLWYKLADQFPMSNIRGDYILIYEFNKDSVIDSVAETISRKTGLRIFRITYFAHRKIPQGQYPVLLPSVEQFLWLVKNATCVVTNSFHALAFCSIFKTKFAAIYPQHYAVRLDDYLRFTGLQNRHLLSANVPVDSILKDIDYTRVHDVLEAKRESTLAFLASLL